MEALRLVSESCNDRVGDLSGLSSATRDDKPAPPQWLDGFSLPSREALLTLLWALKMEERKLESQISNSNTSLGNYWNANMYRSKIDAKSRKRHLEINPRVRGGEKRQRFG